MDDSRIAAILAYWFRDDASVFREQFWFRTDEETDRYIRTHFAADFNKAVVDELREWEATPEGSLALLILLDQFSRNMFRDDGRAFAQDAQALGIARRAIANGFNHRVTAAQRIFFYLPFEHAESVAAQRESLCLFAALRQENPPGSPLHSALRTCYDYAVRHWRVVIRFGRFPHRNADLGRESTPEEQAFLQSAAAPF